MLYLEKDGSGRCPQTIAECLNLGISYGLITGLPQKNSICCNNGEWLFQTYVDGNGKKLPYSLDVCQAPFRPCYGKKNFIFFSETRPFFENFL